jgi:hypothetical protein
VSKTMSVTTNGFVFLASTLLASCAAYTHHWLGTLGWSVCAVLYGRDAYLAVKR